MRISRRRTVAALAGTAALAAALFGAACTARVAEDGGAPTPAVRGQAWPMFGGTVERNMVNLKDKGIPDTWNTKKGKEVNVKWVARLGNGSYASPVVAGGRVFVGTNNEVPRDKAVTGDKSVLMCFRESDGEFLWQAVHDKLPEPEQDGPHLGLGSAPCVEGDRLWYVSNRCELVCADVAGDVATHRAKILWKLDMLGELGVYPGGGAGSGTLCNCSPLILDDLVFAVTSNGADAEGKVPAPKAPSFVAVNKNTGKVVWKDSSPGDKIMDGQWSNPTAAKVNGKWQVIFPGGDGWLYAFEPATGKLLWKFDCNPKSTVYKSGGRGDRGFPVATPVVWENKCYIAVGEEPDNCGSGAGHLWCIDIAREPKNADKDLSPVKDNFDPKAEVNKDSGLIWHHGGPILPKPEDGSRDKVFGRTLSTVAVADGLVYAAEYIGFLQCLDARTGKKYWEYDLKDNTWCSPLYADGKVYVGTDGDLYVFAAGRELKEPKKVAGDGGLKVGPVVANGVLYLNTGTYLYAIALK
jgi:outer membrane protein assembly factor BamB